jgi:hypothetical protein
MASKVEICNRALQKLGAKRIVEIDEDSNNARACNAAYEILKDALLEEHEWNCGIARAQLAASSTAPEFGRSYAYQLPTDFIRLAHPYPEENSLDLDYQIEGRYIVSDWEAPLNIRYVYSIDDPNEMSPLFREALATKIAYELCEELTQSNSKKAELESALDIDCEVLLGKILNMAERSFDNVLLAQVFVDGLRLRRRFHDYQSLWHMRFHTAAGVGKAAPMICVLPRDVTTL